MVHLHRHGEIDACILEFSTPLPQPKTAPMDPADVNLSPRNWPNDSGLDGWVGCLLEVGSPVRGTFLRGMCAYTRNTHLYTYMSLHIQIHAHVLYNACI